MKEARKMFRVRLIFTTFLSYAVATDGMFAHIMWVRRDYWWFSLTLSIILGSHFTCGFCSHQWRRMINAEDEDVLSGADFIDAVLQRMKKTEDLVVAPTDSDGPGVGVLLEHQFEGHARLGAVVWLLKANGGVSFEIAFTTAPQLLLQVYVVFAVQIAQLIFA